MARWSRCSADPVINRGATPRRLADLIIGGAAGLGGGLLGLGGGFILVPLQVIWTKTSQRLATGTSLAAIVPIAVVGAAVYYFGRGAPQINLPVAFFVMLGSSAGAVAGSRLARRVPERALKMLVAGLLLLSAVLELHDGILGGLAATQAPATGNLGPAGYLLIALGGVVIGILSGLSGVGGGVLLVPMLAVGFGIGQRIAQGTSLLAILPTATFGALVHYRQRNVDLGAAGRMALAGAPFALVGGVLALWLPQRVLAILFGFVIGILAIRQWPSREKPNPT